MFEEQNVQLGHHPGNAHSMAAAEGPPRSLAYCSVHHRRVSIPVGPSLIVWEACEL